MKASDLPEEGTFSVTIEKIGLEEIGGGPGRPKETKPVLYFEEFDRALILNKTNARSIAKFVGSEDFDDWIGKTIKLYRTETDFQGDIVEAIRVKGRAAAAPLAKAAGAKSVPMSEPKAAKAATVPPSDEVDDDGIPF